MSNEHALFNGVIRLKTLCVGKQFTAPSIPADDETQFPHNVLKQTQDFKFFVADGFDHALEIVHSNRDIDLLFIDADDVPLAEVSLFVTHVNEFRPKLPAVVFTSSTDDRMRILMRDGAAWHFTKHTPVVNRLAEQIHWYVFSPTKWDEIFAQYTNNNFKPKIEPGLSYNDLEALNKTPEEQYIIKRLFAGSDVVQIFRMDQGFSGSRIYTVKPAHQLKRILKIDVADRLEAVQEKQERLILPRLNRRVGQIQGTLVKAEHLAGACYTLAGSTQDAITLTQYLQDNNLVRKELIDKILSQLRVSLEQLYAGSSDVELRYWAPLYSRVLPTHLTLEEAELIQPDEMDDLSCFIVSAEELTNLSSVPGNSTLQTINQEVQNGRFPQVVLHGFEIAEIDTREGVLYLHDDLVVRYPGSSLLKEKGHPILRFKIRLKESERELLTHPVFRRGKRITVKGNVYQTQDTILAENISQITGDVYDYNSDVFEFASGRYLSPIKNVRYLLWEIGREDMIMPLPQVSPVIHGDLNTSNILIEHSDDVPVWLIDFSDARPGHIYFDLAKLEVEFRTHVFFRLFKEMVDEGFWEIETATQFALLVENMLLETADQPFDTFISALRNHQPDWYDHLYSQFPVYSENLLYFLHSLRRIAETYSPERFKHHYPVAVFFQSIAALKYKGLDLGQWRNWSKRLALCCALVSGKQAIKNVERPFEMTNVLRQLRQRSSFALIHIGSGEERRYLLQWNDNWGMYNLVGGKVDNQKGDRDSFARTIQRELHEELNLHGHKDYRIVKEFKPLLKRQFSKRQYVFKDYEFRVFQIELLPRHPSNKDEFNLFAHRLSPERKNILVSRAEIERLRTADNQPISMTTRDILHDLGEIMSVPEKESFLPLDFELDPGPIVVSRGRAQINGRLRNPEFGSRIENLTIEVLPSATYEVEKDSALLQFSELEPGAHIPVNLWIQPKEKEGDLTMRATFYDVRGQEYRQLLERHLVFDVQGQPQFHIDNPYVVGKPLTPASEALYMGREDVFRWIEENLLGKTQPHTLILYGQRRMGKTSTLYQLVGGKRGQTIREYPGTPIFPVYIDLQRLAGCNMPQFFARLSMQIARSLAKREVTVDLPDEWSIDGNVYHEFDQFLDQIEEKLPPKGLLVLIIDELEQLQDSVERGKLNQDIFPYLRSLMQHRSRMTFILAGTNQLVEDYWSIIFHVGISREIESLSREETERLIRDPVAPMIQYDDIAVDRIWMATRGQPYFSQLICHRLISDTNLVGRSSKIVTLADVRETIDRIVLEDDSHLQHLWNESSSEEQMVMSALASVQDLGDVMVSRIDLASRMREANVTDEALNSALKRLEVRGLVRRKTFEREIQRRLAQPNGWQPTLVSKDYTYGLAFGLLHRWLAQKYPLGALIR